MEKTLAEAFDKCDKDKSGFLEPNEINHVLENWNALIPHKKAPKELELCAKV